MNEMELSFLPPEILVHICQHLDIQSLLRMEGSCRLWKGIIQDTVEIWHDRASIILRHFRISDDILPTTRSRLRRWVCRNALGDMVKSSPVSQASLPRSRKEPPRIREVIKAERMFCETIQCHVDQVLGVVSRTSALQGSFLVAHNILLKHRAGVFLFSNQDVSETEVGKLLFVDVVHNQRFFTKSMYDLTMEWKSFAGTDLLVSITNPNCSTALWWWNEAEKDIERVQPNPFAQYRNQYPVIHGRTIIFRKIDTIISYRVNQDETSVSLLGNISILSYDFIFGETALVTSRSIINRLTDGARLGQLINDMSPLGFEFSFMAISRNIKIFKSSNTTNTVVKTTHIMTNPSTNNVVAEYSCPPFRNLQPESTSMFQLASGDIVCCDNFSLSTEVLDVWKKVSYTFECADTPLTSFDRSLHLMVCVDADDGPDVCYIDINNWTEAEQEYFGFS